MMRLTVWLRTDFTDRLSLKTHPGGGDKNNNNNFGPPERPGR
jgi:hypothetical protein